MKTAIESLKSNVPAGGYGRKMTMTEIRLTRQLSGKTISNRAIVIQAKNDRSIGIVYNPAKNSTGYDNTGIMVCLP